MNGKVYGASSTTQKPGTRLSVECVEGFIQVVVRRYYWIYHKRTQLVYEYVWMGSLLDTGSRNELELLSFQVNYAKKRFKIDFIDQIVAF